MNSFEDNVQKIRDNLEEITCILDDLEDVDTDNNIKDIDSFINRLKLENLYTNELETFIDNYMKFYNF